MVLEKPQSDSYALQVEPDRFKLQNTAIVFYKEALHIEKIRNELFIRLYELFENLKEWGLKKGQLS